MFGQASFRTTLDGFSSDNPENPRIGCKPADVEKRRSLPFADRKLSKPPFHPTIPENSQGFYCRGDPLSHSFPSIRNKHRLRTLQVPYVLARMSVEPAVTHTHTLVSHVLLLNKNALNTVCWRLECQRPVAATPELARVSSSGYLREPRGTSSELTRMWWVKSARRAEGVENKQNVLGFVHHVTLLLPTKIPRFSERIK